MNRVSVKLTVVALLLLMLTGCWNMNELEHMFYIYSIGIEYKDGKYHLLAQVMDFTTIGKQDSGGGDTQTEEGAIIGRGSGKSIHSAIENLYTTSQRRLYWGHLNAIVFGHSVLKHGIGETIDQLTRYSELRYTPWVYATREPVENILLSKPVLESSPVYSQIGDPQDVYRQSSHIEPKRLFELITEMREADKTFIIPLMTTAKGSWFEQKKKYKVVEIEGIAFIKNGKWHGKMDRLQLEGLRWLERETVRTSLFVGRNEDIAILFGGPRLHIDTDVRNGKAYFKLKLKLTGRIGEMGWNESDQHIARRAENQIRQEIINTYRNGLENGIDVFNLLDFLYRKNLKKWQELNYNEGLPLTEESLSSVSVHVYIKDRGRTGNAFTDKSASQ